MDALIGIVFQAVEDLFGAVLPLKNKIHRGFPLLVKKAEKARINFSQCVQSPSFFPEYLCSASV